MSKDVYHYGTEFPDSLALAEEAAALLKSGAGRAGKKALGTEGPTVNLRVHFYNCQELVASGNDDYTSLRQSQRSMVEKSTQDYRIDRKMAPVFHRLPSKLPKSVQAFDRVVELAADAARKEKEQIALKKVARNGKRRSRSGSKGDGGAGSG